MNKPEFAFYSYVAHCKFCSMKLRNEVRRVPVALAKNVLGRE